MVPINQFNEDPSSVAEPACHFDADPDPAFHFDADPDPACPFDADPDPSFQIKAQNLQKILKWNHIPYILACYLQLDADPDPAYHFDTVQILPCNLMRIHTDPDPQHRTPGKFKWRILHTIRTVPVLIQYADLS
jgi:hypothetical protein